MYGDFNNQIPRAVDELAATLKAVDLTPQANPSASLPAHSQLTPPLSRVSSPLPVHIQTSSRGLDDLRRGAEGRQLSGNNTLVSTTLNHNFTPDGTAIYFELCVNYGQWQRRLGEIDISTTNNDGHLFEAVKKKYDELRYSKANYFLEPVDVRYIRVRYSCSSLSFLEYYLSKQKHSSRSKTEQMSAF
jgi:hypothetical protein